jgi:deglycase
MLTNKKIAILIEDMFNVFEFWYPYYRLKEEGAEVMVVGSGRSDVFTGKPGTECKADVHADDVTADDFDGLIIPGGYAPDMMRRYPAMVNLVKEMYQGKKTGGGHMPCRLDARLGRHSAGEKSDLFFCH